MGNSMPAEYRGDRTQKRNTAGDRTQKRNTAGDRTQNGIQQETGHKTEYSRRQDKETAGIPA